MGIRFHCPNGHKMNVKAFLAGKRGYCPDCGALVTIPSGDGSSGDGNHVAPHQPSLSEKDDALADFLFATDDGEAPAAQPVVSKAAVAPAIPVVTAAIAHPAGAMRAEPPPPPIAPAAPVVHDPIAESPTSTWYVRPRAGGQFGPAPGAVLRKWINERRVAVDSLVWREGWPQWRTAGEVFPELGQPATAAAWTGLEAAVEVRTTQPVPVAAAPLAANAAPTTAAAAAPTTPAVGKYRGRRESTMRTVIAIAALGVIALILGGVLVYVLNR